MPLTNFPQGVSSFGIPLIGAGPVLTTGNVFFVNNANSAASNGNLGTFPAKPLATIDFAIGKCADNNGDFIIVGPGHVETITAAGGVTIDVAGISLIGIGRGSARPTINFTTSTAAEFSISAANTYIENFLFTGGIDALVTPIDIASADCWLVNCEYRDVTGQCTECIILRSGADRSRVLGLVYRGASAAGTNAAIAVVGPDDVLIEDFDIDGNFAKGAIDIRSAAATNLRVRNGHFRTRNAADICIIDTVTGSTGQIGPNINARLNDNAANITEAFTGATFVYMQPINVVNLAGESSMQTNITASTDA